MQTKLGPVSIFLSSGYQTMASILSLGDDGEVILKSFQSECIDKVNRAVDEKMEAARYFVTPHDQVPGNCHVHGGGTRWPLYCQANDGQNNNHEANRSLACWEGIACPAGSFCVKSGAIDFRGSAFSCHRSLYQKR